MKLMIFLLMLLVVQNVFAGNGVERDGQPVVEPTKIPMAESEYGPGKEFISCREWEILVGKQTQLGRNIDEIREDVFQNRPIGCFED